MPGASKFSAVILGLEDSFKPKDGSYMFDTDFSGKGDSVKSSSRSPLTTVTGSIDQ